MIKTKKIFVVDGGGDIHPHIEVSEKDWQEGCFSAKLEDGQAIVGIHFNQPGYGKFTTYVGYTTRKAAERLAKAIKK